MAAAGPAPQVDVAGLARLFTTPVLFGEFAPSSYWRDVEVVWPPPAPQSDNRSIAVVFGDCVARLCADAEAVAVALSGGIDSLAVLWHVTRLTPQRRVVAVVVDLVDDDGDRASGLVGGLLRVLGLDDRVEMIVVDPATCHNNPAWSPWGPRMDALPHVNSTAAQVAADGGAQVLLSGNGADELMSVPRYAVADVQAAHGLRGARRYLADMAGAGHGRWGEYAALASNMLARSARTQTYAAATWPQWCQPIASPALDVAWHEVSVRWARRWVRSRLQDHCQAGRSWAQADAWDSWWPRAYLPPATSLPEASPFCDGDVAAAVWGRPLGWRYAPEERSPYLRVKGQVARLFPDDLRPLLPTRKRYYSTALYNSIAGDLTIELAADIGLLDADAGASITCTATRMMAAAVETWLNGAVTAGVAIQPPGRADQRRSL